MNLEQAIKQVKFESEYHKLYLNLQYTANFFKASISKNLKKFGLTSQQYNVLRILRGSYPNQMSVGNVTGRMLDKSSNVTRLVDKLLERKLLTREENPDNRRVQLMCITPEGLKLLKDLDPVIKKSMEVFATLSEKEAFEMNEKLDVLKG